MIGNFWACFGVGLTILIKCSSLGSVRPHLITISFLTQLSGYEWILQNNCAISFVCHILDDFLIIEPPAPTAPFNSFCQVSISNMILSFKNLNIPISAAKTGVPAKLFSSWELFSIHMQWKPGCQRTRFSGLKPPSASFDPSDLQPCKSFNC